MSSSRGIGNGRASLCTDRQLSIIAILPRDHASAHPLAVERNVNVAPRRSIGLALPRYYVRFSPTVFVTIAIRKWREHGGWGRIQGQYLTVPSRHRRFGNSTGVRLLSYSHLTKPTEGVTK